MGEAVLSVKGVTKSYGKVPALRGIDLAFSPGQVGALVGPNGAGKTTLFAIVCGFLGADSGVVTLAGREVRRNQPPAKNALSILPQDAGFMSQLSAYVLLEYYARLSGFGQMDAKREVDRVLELVGIREISGRSPDKMSHGQRKRVGIAQAFIGNPSVIILDEPTAGLDPQVARQIRATIRAVSAGQTVLVASHNLSEIEDLCQEVAIINNGVITRQDRMETLVGAASELSFRMAGSPADAIIAELGALSFVTDCAWDAAAGRLRVHYDPAKIASEKTTTEVVAFLASRGVAFQDMQIGRSLEDRFIDETK